VIGGAAINPSVKDMLVAVEKVLAPVVYLLPNDRNIILAAKEVSDLTKREVVVVPTRTIADGISTLFALLNKPVDQKVVPDELAAETTVVASGSIFEAGRDAEIGGVAVEKNQLVGALDGRNGAADRLVAGPDAPGIAVAMIRAANASGASLATIYYGAGRRLKDAEAVGRALTAEFPAMAAESYYGGQQSSDFVISIEQ